LTSNAPGAGRVLGSLRSAGGAGVVRLEDRFETGVDDLWSALTDPARLAHWMGEVDGDLRPGGRFDAHFFASGWAGSGRVEACEPPRRLLVVTTTADEPGAGVIEAVLTAEGDRTLLVWEERGMPIDQLAAYGAGVQIHLEDLAAHLAGRGRCDPAARWNELVPAYRDLVVG
jgi:uncharacterized protein YndB with AHSA1/START domain